MKITKKIAALLVTIMMLATLVVPVSSEGGAPQTIRDARSSVVRIVSANPQTGEIMGHGSGFIIAQATGKTYIATNRHVVVANYGTDEEVMMMIGVIRTNILEVYDMDLNVIFVSPQGPNDYSMDLVIIEVTGEYFSDRPVLPIGITKDQEPGETVYALGFPGIADQMLEANTFDGTIDSVRVTNGYLDRTNASALNRSYASHGAEIHGGNSGGPLMNARGQVIGINTLGHREAGANIAYALSTEYLLSYCRDNGIPLNTSAPGNDETSPTPGNNDATTDDGIFGSGCVIAGVAGGIILLGGGGLLLIVLVIIIIVVVTKKKKSAPTAAHVPQPAAAPPPPPAAAPVAAAGNATGIKGTGGEYVGRDFPVTNTLLIGRDPARCQIVFQAGTEGVSGLHCELRRVGAALQLTDKGSSNGTFLNGTKIAVNQPTNLKPGDTFYLGSNRNSFSVY
ncbi:MAG: trypsin-like peptidase domain-containing protein [Oscillospiraceae bacterium]|nr:trypsin-like peptidase domain-containing protein [Oscillospiraceae bacterium]